MGLSFDQIRAFHWKPSKQLELADRVLKEALDEAIDIRKQIHALAADPTPEAQRLKETLVKDAEDASDRARLIGDVVVGAFFAEAKDKAREKERTRRLTLVQRWLDGDEAAHAELRQHQADLRARLPVFHWMLEYPEVFYAERPDPLEDGKVNRAAFMDAFIGNPPFAGKNALTESSGGSYLLWLAALHEGSHGNADLSAHFLRRCADLLGDHGVLGVIATNSIAEGDTRQTGLRPLLQHGLVLYNATARVPFDGWFNVVVAAIHLAKGRVTLKLSDRITLDGRRVRSHQLAVTPRRGAARSRTTRQQRRDRLHGQHHARSRFQVTAEQRDHLIQLDNANAAAIIPYVSGEHINTSPDHTSGGFAISLGEAPLDLATQQWPTLVEHLRETVQPERSRNKRDVHRQKWWMHAERRTSLYSALGSLARCIVAAQTTKHVCWTFHSTQNVFSAKVIVVTSDAASPLAVLQSRIHDAWTRLFASTLESQAVVARVS
ncbi:MAG: hypothetical protein M5U28_23140 [Sandaracinaceae bacterium]|nr:hypothetical protein [Sandaracinaceae bacterium]